MGKKQSIKVNQGPNMFEEQTAGDTMVKGAKKEIENLSYEQALAELDEIVSKLENDSPSLEESLELFERGQVLSKHCTGLLDQAELKVKQLTHINTNTFEEGE